MIQSFLLSQSSCLVRDYREYQSLRQYLHFLRFRLTQRYRGCRWSLHCRCCHCLPPLHFRRHFRVDQLQLLIRDCRKRLRYQRCQKFLRSPRFQSWVVHRVRQRHRYQCFPKFPQRRHFRRNCGHHQESLPLRLLR